MGVKDFTKLFESSGEFKYPDFKNKNVAIDASVEIYRAALGMKKIETLTDAYGKPTGHINVILLNILKLKANNANQYWIFDYNSSKDEDKNHNPLKQLELQKRKVKRDTAKEKIKELQKDLKSLEIKEDKKAKGKSKEDELFTDESDVEEVEKEESKPKLSKETCQASIDKQEKAAFTIKSFHFEDVKFMLDMLDIPYLDCPAGFDAEQIAAFATKTNIFDKKMDFVFTPDADALVFGATKLIKRDIRKKKLFKYDLNEILTENELSQDDFIKVCLMLGTDFAPKSPKIGPKTVLKKYKDTELSEDQLKAMNCNFKRVLTAQELDEVRKSVQNTNGSFTDPEKYTKLLDWLELVKNFNRERIEKQFKKNGLFVE